MRNLKEYTIRCMKELEAVGIEYGNIIEVKVNTRAKKRWGQCRAVPGGYSININAVLLDERNDEQGLKETIIHELLHSCKGCMNHSEKWKRLATKVNRAYNYNIKRCSTAEDKGVQEETTPISLHTVNYVIKCNKCGCTYTRTRMSKVVQHPERYRCRCCGGGLGLV